MSEPKKVIIPAAKIVPEELQRLGKLPGVIYPINQKITFDYLYEEYKDRCSSIDVICYEAADKVQRRLSKYLGDQVAIKVLPELGDLGQTVFYALEAVQEPCIIHFSDTIVMDHMTDIDGDAFFCQEDYMSDTWTFFDEADGVITNLYDKRSICSDVKKPLFVGVFQIMDSPFFRACLEESIQKKSAELNTFYDALRTYSRRYPLQAIPTSNWFDIGHEDKYYNTKLEVRSREFNHITIDKNRGILRKTSDNKEKFIGEIQWYLKLPGDVEYVRPRIFSYSTSYEAPYICMEYYAYHTLHELFLYGDLSLQQWMDVFEHIRFVCNDFKRYTVTGDQIPASLEDMYLKKTLQRLEKLKSDERFIRFFQAPITVNGMKYQSLSSVIEILKQVIPEALYDVEQFHIIHGDLCFANIMVDSNCSFIKVIDPRGKFGAYDIYGDFRYELAKLFHSIDGKYDFIIKDLFDLEYDLSQTSITYAIQDRKRDYDLYQAFLETFRKEIGEDLKKIELIEALLFLSMIPLHGESLSHQLIMLGTGLTILNRVTDISEKGGANNVS